MKKTTRIGRRKTAIGIAILCALALGTIATASVSAKGLTAYTCVKGKGVLNGAHCLGTSGGEYGHVEIIEKTTGLTTNANTASETTAASTSILKGVLKGFAAEIQCSGVTGTLTVENKTNLAKPPEMVAHGEGTLTYTGCTMLKPAGCKVPVELATNNLTGTTEGIQGAEPHTAQIAPAGATPILETVVTSCTNSGLNGTYPVAGSLKAKISGATLTSIHNDITAQKSLTWGAVNAGLEGAVTLKAHSNAGEETKPLTVTTE